MMKRAVCLAVMACGLSAVCAERVERAEAVPPKRLLSQSFGERDIGHFHEPPKVFYPETWFHFIGGNVAREGITADLEAMAAAKIQGVQFFHGQFGGPWPGVTPQIKCLSESWDDLLSFVARECERLGLRFTMQNCPGWAMAGGPWIAPSNAMRHLIFSRSEIKGGRVVTQVLPRPEPSGEPWRDYKDVAVVAFPTPAGDTAQALIPQSVTGSREGQPWEKCLKNEPGGKVTLPADGKPTWIEVAFSDPVTVRTVQFPSVEEFNHGWCYLPGVTITVYALASEGEQEVARYVMPPSTWQEDMPISLACSDAEAKVYRIKIENAYAMTFRALQLFSVARKNNWESEAAYVLRGLMREPHPRQTAAAWVDNACLLDVTDRMDENGRLRWLAPHGRWTILRWGHVNTGKKNGPAPAEATGWECDKLSARGADAHFAGYIGRMTAKKGPVGAGRLQGMLLDSWECETQTWTPGIDTEFLRRRGYPLLPWMPALAGYVVGSPETTTRFLRDWRTFVNDQVVENFFGQMTRLARKNRLTVSFETASGDVFPGDILEYYKHADVPMCEFWQPRTENFVGSLDFKPIKPCASAARLYGKPRVAAEAFTSFALTWNERWEMLKEIANLHFAEGVTHLVFHTYTHTPRTDGLPPGTSFGAGIGTPFLRGQTWWRHMPHFTDYLARCGYLLERGVPVSDVLLYLGDEQDHKPPQEMPFPAGFKYDYCNPDALLNRLSVDHGDLVTPEGVRYRLLWLRECPRMVPETLERLAELVRKGATVVGDAPHGLATLSGGERAQARFDEAVQALWGEVGGPVDRRVGRGRVISGVPLEGALARMGLEPDIVGQHVWWSHRRAKGAEWYFVAASGRNGFRGTLDFRSLGRAEIWDPVSGTVAVAGVVARAGGRSRIALDLPPAGACFVVFRDARADGCAVVRVDRDDTVVLNAADGAAGGEPSTNRVPSVCEAVDGGRSLIAWEPGAYRVSCVDGADFSVDIRHARKVSLDTLWRLSFPQGWDAPAYARVDTLGPWSDLDLAPAARAYSGTAYYTRDFDVGDLPEGTPVSLDLGRVEMIASVRVNGQEAGTVWAAPYRVDLTKLVKPGVNWLVVEVTSTWFNRLAFDAGLPEAERKTWTLNGPDKTARLQPSGLLGPVSLCIGERVVLRD